MAIANGKLKRIANIAKYTAGGIDTILIPSRLLTKNRNATKTNIMYEQIPTKVKAKPQ